MRWALALLLLVGCTSQNEVQLILPPNGAAGLACVDSSTGNPLLSERAQFVDGAAVFSVAVDYLSFDGVPSCRPTQLLQWCSNLGCPAVARDCLDVRLEPPIENDLPNLQRQVLDALAEQGTVTANAPDGVVVIRMAVSTQSCEEIGGGPHRCDQLLGCVYSCPVQLDEVEGMVLLELDSLGDVCDETIVGICAGLGFEGESCVP